MTAFSDDDKGTSGEIQTTKFSALAVARDGVFFFFFLRERNERSFTNLLFLVAEGSEYLS